MQERLRAMSDRRRVAAQAAFESDLLRDWRAERRRTAHRNYCYVVGSGQGDEQRQGQQREQREQRELQDVVRDHRRQWRAFEALHASLRAQAAMSELVYDDVPWIPEGVTERAYLAHVARDEHGGDVKKAYAAMCLAWHPDKFQNRYRGFFTEGEWARVVRRVNETFARFTGDDDRSDNL